jgi:hypothetical protein
MTKKNFKKDFSDLLGDNKTAEKREASASKSEGTASKRKAAASKKEKGTENSSVKTMVLSDLTAQSIEKTKAAIDEGLSNKTEVEIIAENVDAIDLSYIQLILSLNKTYSGEKVSFKFKGDIPGDLRNLLDSTGFSTIY